MTWPPTAKAVVLWHTRIPPMKARSNQDWLVALKSDGEAQTAALSDLRAYLLRTALYALYRSRSALRELAPTDIAHLAEDCAQEAVSAILGHLDQFRGDSQFTTWAYKFAVNATLVAARRERWGRVRLERLLGSDLIERIGSAGDASSDPHRQALQGEILAALREGIESHLTSRQRQALIAIVFEEVPLDELARHWGSNRNALYKLLHDARRKLKAHLRDRGFDAQEVLDVFENDR
jgi:RNA polymerase sigma-70 factor (ECF subfamily)